MYRIDMTRANRRTPGLTSQLRGSGFFLALLILFGCFAGCSESVAPDNSRLGYNFFPLEKGQYRIYDVNSTEYFFSAENITRNYQLKEFVADTFQNLEGGISYRMERFTRNDESEEWQLDSVWTARSNATQAIQVEHNLPLLKLVFPFRENKTWDANVYNDKAEDEHEMVGLFQAFVRNDEVVHENTVTVIQEEVTNNILFWDVRKEVYGENVGLVYKEITQLEYCAEADCLGQAIIEAGIEYTQQIREYGKE